MGINCDKPIDMVNGSVKNYVDEFFLELIKADNNIFNGFKGDKNHILDEFKKELDELRQKTTDNIVDKIFKVSIKENPYIESADELEKEVAVIESKIKNDINNIHRQIKFCMILLEYERKGLKFYRFNSIFDACDECKERGGRTFLISEIMYNKHYFNNHSNCRCTIEILDSTGNVAATIDSSGNVRTNFLDGISDFLTVASLVPGIDTFADLAAIPVDLARGDFLSAGLDALGAIPFVGEVADTAKIAKTVDKAVDAGKVADKASNVGEKIIKIPKLPKTLTELKSNGWKETTSAEMKKRTTSRTFEKNGLTIRFDKGKKDVGGYGGKDHYHILNSMSTGKHDYYLDKYGNPVPKNSKASHILP